MSTSTHSVISPAILYWGTPIVLISSENEDGTCNIAPVSSAWWLGRSCVLGLGAGSKTTENILRTKQCVLNLPDDTMTYSINALARTTGSNPVNEFKTSAGYIYVKDKFAKAGLPPVPSDFIRPSRIAEAPVQMECEMLQTMAMRPDLPDRHGAIMAIEVRVIRIHIANNLRMEGYANRVDPDKWRPIFMSFQELYGLADGKITESVLGRIPEEKYRGLTRSDEVKLAGDDDHALSAEAEKESSQTRITYRDRP